MHPRPELALLALGVGPGQEVICPSFTFVSTANAVLRVGARPVFADIEDRTLGLDPAGRRPGAVSRRTAALLPVHYAGVAPDMDALLDLARRPRAARDRGRRPGPRRHLARTSARHPGRRRVPELPRDEEHHLRRGGRAGRRRSRSSRRRAEIIREKGTNRAAFFRGEVDKYTWVAEGSSYVLSDVLAAVLDAQLDKLRGDPATTRPRWSRATARGSPIGRDATACA